MSHATKEKGFWLYLLHTVNHLNVSPLCALKSYVRNMGAIKVLPRI